MKNKFTWNRDRIASVVTFLLAVGIFWECNFIKATYGSIGGSDIGSRAFPQLIAGIMLVCSIGKFITCDKPDEKPFVPDKAGWLRMLITLAILSGYVAALSLVGFLPATFVACVLLVKAMKMDKPYRWLSILLFSALVTGGTYLIFNTIMGILLPEGSLWTFLG